MKTAEFWSRLDSGRIECELCPHRCKIAEGHTGLCMVRRVEGGELKAIGYGLISSAHVDPIEKKPLYHFLPGSEIFSIGGWGCNFACRFCQNWSISQQVMEASERYTPQQVVAKAREAGAPSIAYTYNEPLVGFEFVYECCGLAREEGLINVLVTNGYVERAPAEKLLPLVGALNIDIKSMDDAFYQKLCRGRLQPVLDFSKQAVQAGCYVEITNLLIPTLNDKPEQIERLAVWIRGNLGEKTPLHLSAYHPDFKLDVEATPPALLETAYDICRKHLSYVYTGNVISVRGQNTVCPQCGKDLITRRGYRTRITGVRDSACAGCGRRADVIVS